MQDKIQEELTRLESVHGVKIILAVESGSRVWGFASPDSDYDVRYLYLRPLAWYLSVRERRDVIEGPLDGLLDFSGWDLKKGLHLLSKSSPPLVEWLSSPTVYRNSPLADQLRGLVGNYFNPRSTIYHYLHMANGNYRDYLRGDEVRLKKYFYVLRPLLCCAWVEKVGGAPPLPFDDLLTVADWDAATAADVQDLLARKKGANELGTGPRMDRINAWIETKLAHFADLARTTAKGPAASDDLDQFLVSALYAQIGK